MSDEEKQENEPVPPWQRVFDNIWLLFLLSLLVSSVIYNAWGLYELLHVPPVP